MLTVQDTEQEQNKGRKNSLTEIATLIYFRTQGIGTVNSSERAGYYHKV